MTDPNHITLALVVPAFIAGVLTFLAPCTLPLVPGFLAFISGSSVGKNTQDAGYRSRVLINALLYVFGFSTVFILLGSIFGLGGAALAPYRFWLSRIGGVLVIFFGLFLIFGADMKLFRFLQNEKKFHVKAILDPGKPGSSFLLGATFAFGWTPCVGPLLGTILLLASTSATVLNGAFLLGVFSFGLGLPFLVLAFFIGSAAKYIQKIQKYLGLISKIGGILLVVMGVLLLFDLWALWLTVAYEFFDFIQYDDLLKYL